MATKGTIASIIKESFQEINVMKIMPNRTVRICLISSAKVVLNFLLEEKYLRILYFEALPLYSHHKI